MSIAVFSPGAPGEYERFLSYIETWRQINLHYQAGLLGEQELARLLAEAHGGTEQSNPSTTQQDDHTD